MRSFVGITGHFFSGFALQTVMVACKRFHGSHTADGIHQVFEETLASYTIQGKISAVVTDNASNMVRAFSFPGLENINEPELPDPDEVDGEMLQPTGDDLDDFTYERLSCFIHTLQLTVKDGLKDVGKLRSVIAKVAALVAHVRRSCNASEVLDGCLKLQPANQTRWNSQLKMLRSLLRIPQANIDQLDFPGKLTTYETKLVRELCDILTPLETATDMVQGDHIVTSSLVSVCIRGLRAELNRLQEVYNCKLVTSLQASLERRLAPYEDMEVYQLATTLDPRFKLNWCDEREGAALVTPPPAAVAPPASTSADGTESPPYKRCRLLSFLANANTAAALPADVEVSEYLPLPALANDSDPLTFWKDNRMRFPKLSKLACKYLALPGSSAPVERLFSVAGKIFRPECCSISDSRFEEMMLIRCNE